MKLRTVAAFLVFLLALALTLILNGTIFKKQFGLPPIAKLVNPFHGFWGAPETSPEYVLDSPYGKVEIIYDQRAVPHIFADNDEALFFGQGFVEARDRLFQMYFLKAVASGQLSSIFGERTVNYDLQTHKKGIPQAIKETTEMWRRNERAVSIVHAYAAGANRVIEQLDYKDLPFEMKLFDLETTPWDLESTVSIFKYMGNFLAGGNDDIENNNLRLLLGNELYAKLYREVEDVEEPIIPLEVSYDFDTIIAQNHPKDALFDEVVYDVYFEKRNKNVGSNNWAVGGSRTKSGLPILSSDPHLSLTVPSIWYELNLVSPKADIYGVSFPGVPAILIGFNDQIAWGETNVGHDIQDIFHIRYTDETHTHYWLDGKKVPVEYRLDTVFVKNSDPVIDTTLITFWGPIVKQSNDRKTDLAMKWLVAEPQNDSEGLCFVEAGFCKDYDCFLKETARFITPAQNFLYADEANNIALRVNGLLPARTTGDGRFIAEGDQTKYDWPGFIPREQLPQVQNPSQGFVTSSNQRSAGPDYPYYYTGNFERYRNRAINDKLDTMNQVTAEQMMEMQNNNYSKKAEDFVPIILAATSKASFETEKEKELLTILSQWDYNYETDAIAPYLFNQLMSTIRRNTFDEIAQYRDTMAISYPPYYVLKEMIVEEPEHDIFDALYTIEKENATDIIRKAVTAVVAKLEAPLTDYAWSKKMPVNIPHVARIPGLGVENMAAPGYGDVINATNWSFGPSWRMVIPLGDGVKKYGIYPGGQSGDPRNKHYKDLLEKWRTGQYDELIYGLSKEELKNQLKKKS